MESRLRIACILMLCSIGVSQGADVEYSGHTYVPAGDDIHLNCTAFGNVPIKWTRNSQEITRNTGVNILTQEKSKGVMTSDLTITNVSPEHTGVYRCTEGSSGIGVRIVDGTGSDTFYEGPGAVIAGQQVTIACYTAIGQSPHWTKDGGDVPSGSESSRIRVLINSAKVSKLTFYKARHGHSGMYKCINSDKRHMLRVLTENSVIANKAKVQLVPGAQLFLPCKSSVHPALDMEWTFNGQRMIHDNISEFDLKWEQGGLLAERAECKHAGTYTCKPNHLQIYRMHVEPAATCGASAIYFTGASLLILVGGWWGRLNAGGVG